MSRQAKRKLIVTESPGKSRALSTMPSFKKNGFKAVACMGRLYELDPISPQAFFSGDQNLSWTPIKPDVLNKIKDYMLDSSEIYIATDPDIEGEVIAWQLAKLIEHIGKDESKVFRINMHEISEKGLSEAMKKKTHVSPEKAQAGISRRVFDNFSRFAFPKSKTDKYPFLLGGHGRIVTPTLGSISRHPLTTHVVKYQRPGMAVPAMLEVTADQDVNRLLDKLERLPSPVLSNINTTESPFKQEGLDYSTIMEESLKTTQKSAPEIHQGLQRLYEKGEISYFRTDSRKLSKDHEAHLKRSLLSEGATSFNAPDSQAKDRDQEGHTAIVPLKKPHNAWSSISNKPLDDQILSLIWRYWSIHAQKRSLKTTTAELNPNAFENREWAKLAKQNSIRFEEQLIVNSNGVESPYDPEFLPLGIRVDTTNDRNSTRRKLEIHESLARRLREIDLGRPSTVARHIDKIGRNFIKESQVNKRGLSSIREASIQSPALLEPQTARGIESDLHKSHSENEMYGVLRQSLEKIKSREITRLKGIENREGSKPRHQIDFSSLGL